MKTFAQLREKLDREPSGKKVFSARLSGVQVVVNKEGGKYVAYIDGDRLDSYKTEKQAIDMAKQFVTQYKG